MMMPDLKPCQAAARGTIRWKDDWQTNFFVCRADCVEINRHAEARARQEYFDGFIKLITEQNVMRELCKCCKEVADGNA